MTDLCRVQTSMNIMHALTIPVTGGHEYCNIDMVLTWIMNKYAHLSQSQSSLLLLMLFAVKGTDWSPHIFLAVCHNLWIDQRWYEYWKPGGTCKTCVYSATIPNVCQLLFWWTELWEIVGLPMPTFAKNSDVRQQLELSCSFMIISWSG